MATKALPSRNAAATTGNPQNPPNQTLYCSNLPDKLQKQDLRLSMYTLFSTYGPVLDVVALKTMKMRGQAHIVFRDVQASTQAMRALQGFDLFGKQMRISYAKGKSDMIAKLDGTFKMPTANLPNAAVESTELQQSIFNAPPGAITAPPRDTLGAALKPPPSAIPFGASEAGAKSPQGVKRRREEEDEEEESEQEDAPMEEDDDSDAPMEGSSDEE